MPDTITMRGFGKWGRAGNQFFQYAFLTGYAERYGATLQLPKWCGTRLFGTEHLEPTAVCKPWMEPGSGLNHPTPPVGNELVGRDFHGYAQYGTSYFASDCDRIRRVFRHTDAVERRLKEPRLRLLDTGRTIVAIHLRRGDYGQNIFPIIPTSWYLEWLDKHWDTLDKPSLFIATEDAGLVGEFAQYSPHTTDTLGIGLSDEPMANTVYLKRDLATRDRRALDWYPDFHLLTCCDIMLGPSSTFSFFAAMLNRRLKQYYRASLAAEGFVKTDPWDAHPLMREHVRDYAHLDGITMADNPYWH